MQKIKGRFCLMEKHRGINETERIEMTNEEYREELKRIFDNIEETYKLRWFYRFIKAKLEGSN